MVATRLAEKYRRTYAGWKISEIVAKTYFSTPITEGWAGENLHHMKRFT
jgi:hypothetical protein